MMEYVLFIVGLFLGTLGYFLFIRMRVLKPLKNLHHSVQTLSEHPLAEIPEKPSTP
ncbi:MAG: hypothetical protein ACP5D0_09310 [Hydrogenovibrio sp.]